MIYQNLEFFDIDELIPAPDGGDGVTPLRCPSSVRAALTEMGQTQALSNSGAEIRFVLNEGEEATLTLRRVFGTVSRCLVYYGSVQGGHDVVYRHIFDRPTELKFSYPAANRMTGMHDFSKAMNAPFSPLVIRLMLPNEGGKIAFLGVKGNVRPPRADEVPQKKLLFYGSSITHGSLAGEQDVMWTERAAKKIGWDELNQGYAGSCRVEAAMADHLASRGDWDACVAELGINCLDMDPDEYRRRVRYFLSVMREKNPDKYLFLVNIFYFDADYYGKPIGEQFRRINREEFSRIRDEKTVLFEPEAFFDSPAFLSGDLVHPNAEGAIRIGDRLAELLRPYLAE